MKKYASIAAVLALISSVTFVSCKKDEKVQPSKISYTGTAIVGNPITFRGDGSGITSYFWDFGDSSKSDQATPAHTYSKPGKYDVLLMLNGNQSTVSWAHITIHKDPVYTKEIGSVWRWTHKESDIRTGVDAIYNDTTFTVTYFDALKIAIDNGDTLSYDDDKSIDTVLVFDRIASGATHDMPDTTHVITFYPTKDSIIYTIVPGYSNINVGRTTTYRTKK